MNTTAQEQVAEQQYGKVFAEWWGANTRHTVRICKTCEFSTPETLMTIPFPAGCESYSDLPADFLADVETQVQQSV